MYQSKRSPLMIFISLALVILTACAPAAPTGAPAAPQATRLRRKLLQRSTRSDRGTCRNRGPDQRREHADDR